MHDHEVYDALRARPCGLTLLAPWWYVLKDM